MHGSDKTSVVGTLSMSVDTVDSTSFCRQGADIDIVDELDMVCMSDCELSDESVVFSGRFSRDYAYQQPHRDKNSTSLVLETTLTGDSSTQMSSDESCRVESLSENTSLVKSLLRKTKSEPHFAETSTGTNGKDVMTETDCMSSVAKKSAQCKLSVYIAKQHTCSYCSKAFRYRSHLILHMKQHQCDSRWACEICRREFLTLSGLQKHRRVHDTIQPYRCSLCLKTFSFASVLREHLHIHSTVCQFICEFCGQRFKQVSNLLKHRHVVHKIQDLSPCQHLTSDASTKILAPNRFQCPVCSKVFTTKAYIQMHLRVHTGERPYCCQLCHFKFKQKSNLSKHMVAAHSSERRFSCRFCSKMFAVNSNCKDHEKIHTDDRQFECSVCCKSFITAAALRAHINRCHGDNPS